jgi:hypothetical protein
MITRLENNDPSFKANLVVVSAGRIVEFLLKLLYRDLRYSTRSPACFSVSPKEKCLL